AVLAGAGPRRTAARRLAEWAPGRRLDETAASMLLQIAGQWLELESALGASGIAGDHAPWKFEDERFERAASCLHDLVCHVRRDVEWFKYLPGVTPTCLLGLAPDARMGMPHAVFAQRL